MVFLRNCNAQQQKKWVMGKCCCTVSMMGGTCVRMDVRSSVSGRAIKNAASCRHQLPCACVHGDSNYNHFCQIIWTPLMDWPFLTNMFTKCPFNSLHEFYSRIRWDFALATVQSALHVVDPSIKGPVVFFIGTCGISIGHSNKTRMRAWRPEVT